MSAKKLIKIKNFWGSERSLTIFLFFQLTIVFIFPLLPSDHLATDITVDMVMIFLLISGIVAFPQSHLRTIFNSLLIGAAAFISVAGYIYPENTQLDNYEYLIRIFFFIMLGRVILTQVFKDGDITTHRIVGSISVYILIGIIWADIYHLLYIADPASFSLPPNIAITSDNLKFQFNYFSFVAMTSVGYGDILPVSQYAKTFMVAEALIGQLFPAILIGRLVSLLSNRKKS